jgi:hypothetical protein
MEDGTYPGKIVETLEKATQPKDIEKIRVNAGARLTSKHHFSDAKNKKQLKVHKQQEEGYKSRLQLTTSKVKAKINIKQLKEFVEQQFPLDAPLRQILLAENDEVEVDVFVSRLPIYLRLNSLKKGRN